MPGAKISALGCYVPPGVLTNQDLEKMVDTTDQWILERTGISERHIAAPDVATSDMAVEAARCVLLQRGIEATEIEAIIVCTVTPDMMFPSTACLVQDRIGAKGAWGFDLVAACSGFLYGLTTAAHLVMAGTHKKVMVIGADTMSRIIDYTDRSTCILFGDAAGAMIVEPAEAGEGFIGFMNEVDGSGGDFLKMPARRQPHAGQRGDRRASACITSSRKASRFSSLPFARCTRLCQALLDRHGLTAKDVKVLVAHQANRRIITGYGGAAGDVRGSGDHQYRALRKYHRGDHSAGRARRRRVGQA